MLTCLLTVIACNFLECWGELIGIAVVIGVAILAWRQHRKIAARRGTLDFLLKNEVDNEGWRETRHKVRQILDPNGEQLRRVLCPQSAKDWSDRFMVGAFLSRYEFIAVAIKYKAMDEAIYKEWNGPAYVRMWNRAKQYIERRRCGKASRKTSRKTRYIHFQRLAEKWEKEFPEDSTVKCSPPD